MDSLACDIESPLTAINSDISHNVTTNSSIGRLVEMYSFSRRLRNNSIHSVGQPIRATAYNPQVKAYSSIFKSSIFDASAIWRRSGIRESAFVYSVTMFWIVPCENGKGFRYILVHNPKSRSRLFYPV